MPPAQPNMADVFNLQSADPTPAFLPSLASTSTATHTLAPADLNGDGGIDTRDSIELLRQMGD